jgi:hypothetical protein
MRESFEEAKRLWINAAKQSMHKWRNNSVLFDNR